MHVFVKILVVIVLAGCSATAGKDDLKDCKHPLDPGKPCSGPNPLAAQKMFYFNRTTESCPSFIYLGCEGNANKFSESDDCIDSCQTPWLLKKEKNGGDEQANVEKLRKKSDCQLEPKGGPCKALYWMYYFDPSSGKCKGFSYGGCEGNRNRFSDKTECETFCK